MASSSPTSTHNCSTCTNRTSWPSTLRRNVRTLRSPLLVRGASTEARSAHDCLSSNNSSNVADAILSRIAAAPSSSEAIGPGSLPVRVFLSQSGYFHLDGRWETSDGSAHPDGILTACASADVTLREFTSSDLSAWQSRYIVESIQGAGPGGAIRSIVGDYIRGDEWIDALSSWGENNEPIMRQLFVSIGETRTQLHRDHFDNLFLCLSGTRHWRLAHPDHSDRVQLEEGSVSAGFKLPPLGNRRGDAGSDCQSFVHNGVPFTEVTVEAGDALFVPSGWWHDVTANLRGTPSSVAVNWYFDPPGQGLSG